MVNTILFNEEAYHEYIEAYYYYELLKIGLGNGFTENIEIKLKQIKEHPEAFNKKKRNYREAKVEVFPYNIVYEYFKRKNLVYIIAVYHNKRKPELKYRRRK